MGIGLPVSDRPDAPISPPDTARRAAWPAPRHPASPRMACRSCSVADDGEIPKGDLRDLRSIRSGTANMDQMEDPPCFRRRAPISMSAKAEIDIARAIQVDHAGSGPKTCGDLTFW